MSRWFRHYAGMMRDEKLVSVAMKSKQPVERVVWVWGALLESASEINDNGAFEFDAAEAAYFLRADEADICRILASLEEMGRVHGRRVVKWGDRQFQSDSAAERQKRYRDRRKEPSDGLHVTGGDVTRPSRDGAVTPQDTETDNRSSSLRSDEPAPRKRDRAARLDANWTLPDGWGQDAIDVGLPANLIDLEAAKMRDWSLSAAKGACSDWRARWRNWCRSAAERLPQARASPPPRPGNASDLLKAMRQDRPSHDERPPDRTLLIASR